MLFDEALVRAEIITHTHDPDARLNHAAFIRDALAAARARRIGWSGLTRRLVISRHRRGRHDLAVHGEFRAKDVAHHGLVQAAHPDARSDPRFDQQIGAYLTEAKGAPPHHADVGKGT